jgi:hypothetical protein
MRNVAVIASRFAHDDRAKMSLVSKAVRDLLKTLSTENDCLITGGSMDGADRVCRQLATEGGYLLLEARCVPRNTQGVYQPHAGPRRLRGLVLRATEVLAILDGKDSPAHEAVKYAESLGRPVTVVPLP